MDFTEELPTTQKPDTNIDDKPYEQSYKTMIRADKELKTTRVSLQQAKASLALYSLSYLSTIHCEKNHGASIVTSFCSMLQY